MKRVRKKILTLALVMFGLMMMVPVTANAAKPKKVNVDKYLELGKNYTVIAYNNNNSNLKVYKKKTLTGATYGTINYGGAAVVNTSKLKVGKATTWIPIYMYNHKTENGYKTGYIKARYLTLTALNKKKFSENSTINRAIKTGFKYLGTPFLLPGSSLTKGIDCAQFVAAVYRKAGKGGLGTHTNYLQAACTEVFYQKKNKRLSKAQINKMQPGDLLFYLQKDTWGPIDHVAIYIGNGLMINSSGHYGSTYPNGGICIKKVQYGKRNIVRCMRLRGI